MEVPSEIKRLRQELEEHNYRYYVLDQPTISDAEYDKKFKKLLELESEHPEFFEPSSPSQKIGGRAAKEFSKVKHRVPMQGLQNVYSLEEMTTVFDRWKKAALNFSLVAEPKFDGLAVEIKYQDGIFKTASTRGDGETGEDVTANVKTIKSIPLRLRGDFPTLLEVRGEILLMKEDFQNINRERVAAGEPPFANPRNAAAGSIRQLNPTIAAKRNLDCFFHGISEAVLVPSIKSQWELFTQLKNWGLKTNQVRKLLRTITEIQTFYKYVESERSNLAYEVDGIVLKINEFHHQRELGSVARSPRWAIAFKFKAMEANTILRDVIFQVGRTGVLTPVAVLDPVEIGGVDVARAGLHNADQIKMLGLKLGDTVVVKRAGDVIPNIESVVIQKRTGTERAIKFPTQCPICDSKVIRIEGEVAHRCPNMACPGRLAESLKHFANKRAMNIEGLGDKWIEALLNAKLIVHFSDIYALTKNDIQKLERQGERSSEKLINSIDKSKNTTLDRLIFALGIRLVGERTAELLATHFGTIELLMNATLDDLKHVEEVGETVALSIRSFFDDAHNVAEIRSLLKKGIQIEEVHRESRGDQLAGMTFVVTGTLSTLSRSGAEDLIRSHGGKISSSVSKKTNYVVVGTDAGSKLTKARELGIKLLDEISLRKLCANSSKLN